MRFQALMPDVLHWLGIQKIDRMMVRTILIAEVEIVHAFKKKGKVNNA